MAPSTSQTFPFPRTETYQPAPELGRLQQTCPIAKAPLFDGSEAWIITTHEDIKKALSTSSLSADRRAHGYPEIHEGGAKAKAQKPTFVNLDNPEHNNQRDMLESSFTPDAVEKYKPMIQDVVDRCLANMVKKHQQTGKPVDLIEEFAAPVPTQIVYKLLGVPDKDIPSLSNDSSVRTGTSRTAAEQANHSLQDYMTEMVEARIKDPKNDLISKLVVEQLKDGKLEKEDVVNLAFLVLTAGNAALINSIGLGVLTLLKHPAQLQELKQGGVSAKDTVNELLRYNTASALNSRRAAKEDFEVGGQHVKKGEGVICAVQAGDRDEDKTDHADQFDIHRHYDPKDVLGFGYGPHRCQGEALSRAELEAVFGTLFKRCPELKLAVSEEELSFTPPTQNIGVQKLPVTL